MPPAGARNPELYEKQNRPVPTLRVVKEDDKGVVIRTMSWKVFGFAPDPAGHVKAPQLGRVLVGEGLGGEREAARPRPLLHAYERPRRQPLGLRDHLPAQDDPFHARTLDLGGGVAEDGVFGEIGMTGGMNGMGVLAWVAMVVWS